ncbi:hypothetical protein, partial [Actinocorallia lasiicapitis]
RPQQTVPPVAVPVIPPVQVPAVPAPAPSPLVAANPELVLSHHSPVLVTGSAPAKLDVAEDADLASELRSYSGPDDSPIGPKTGFAVVGVLLLLGLVSAQLVKGRLRRSGSGEAS